MCACKEFWTQTHGKRADALKTNNKGTFVSHDDSFRAMRGVGRRARARDERDDRWETRERRLRVSSAAARASGRRRRRRRSHRSRPPRPSRRHHPRRSSSARRARARSRRTPSDVRVFAGGRGDASARRPAGRVHRGRRSSDRPARRRELVAAHTVALVAERWTGGRTGGRTDGRTGRRCARGGFEKYLFWIGGQYRVP